MNGSPISKLASRWATRRGGGGQTERRYRDILLDGVAFSTIAKSDVISAFGWLGRDEEGKAIDRLLLRAPADLPEGRVSFYLCPECGDLGCGAVSLIVQREPGSILWKDFGFQNNYEDVIHREGLGDLGPFFFDEDEYAAFFEALRRRDE